MSTETVEPRQTAGEASDEPAEGPVLAAVLAAGIGGLTLGLLTTLAEASTGVKDFLQFNDRVGPLSGKTIFAAIAYFASWGILTAAWRRSSPPFRTVVIATVVLLALAVLGTFPTFFQAFASD